MSRKVFPSKLSTSSIRRSDCSASAMRASSSSARKRRQFSPNVNRPPPATSSACELTSIRLSEFSATIFRLRQRDEQERAPRVVAGGDDDERAQAARLGVVPEKLRLAVRAERVARHELDGRGGHA